MNAIFVIAAIVAAVFAAGIIVGFLLELPVKLVGRGEAEGYRARGAALWLDEVTNVAAEPRRVAANLRRETALGSTRIVNAENPSD